MSDSTDNTNELDSYGVWVKNTNQDEGTDDALNFADSLDLPDFEENDTLDDSDFSDMFKEDDTINLDSSSDDTTLTDDELLNITNGDGIEIAEADAGQTDDSLNEVDFSTEIGDDFNVDDNPLDDVSFDSLEENSVTDADLGDSAPVEDNFSIDEPVVEEPAVEAPAEKPAAEEVSVDDFATEDVSDDFGIETSTEADGEEEISLDDFMDSGFSDETVASGNNGFAADAAPAPAGDSEEVSLDDFVDMSEFGVTEEAPKKEETIADEKPLDMDISFDSSADTIETEENIETEDMLDDDFLDEQSQAPASESTETAAASDASNDIEAEEVDLSDFGIDADAEETPVTQDVEGSKVKDTIVDYDLSVGDGNMNAAPVVNEIKASANNDAIENIEEVAPVEEAPAVSAADSSLLQQIVADLSNLKEEINALKSNLEEMKAAPAPAASESSGIISEEIAVDEAEDESSKEDTGFFSGDDGDDTIALSTDELSNILNTADFSNEEAPAQEEAVEETVASEDVVAENDFAEEETAVPEPEVEAADALNFTEPEGKQEDLSYDFTDENLSEPNIDEIEIDEGDLEDDLPDEISIPKDDDIFVESSSSDFMDSVQDTTEEHEQEEAAEDSFSTVDNLFEEESPDNVISEVSGFMAEPAEEAPVVEETPAAEEEPVIQEETVAEEPAFDESTVIDEEPVEDETFVEEPVEDAASVIPEPAILENDFVSHEDDNNNLTDSNIDYLTTEDKEEIPEDTDENAELKKDIKSVLLYMDQLLENLPEEKIVEFAKSDEFTTYKKLFSELGLS